VAHVVVVESGHYQQRAEEERPILGGPHTSRSGSSRYIIVEQGSIRDVQLG